MSRITRRRFFGDSLFAAAAAAVTASSSRPLFAQGPGVAPNDRIGVAVVGAGGRGGSHVDAFVSDPRTEVLYVIDADLSHAEQRAEHVKEKTGVKPKVLADMRDMLPDESVHVVSTATPNHWHALVSVWAMQSGKDVYVEKPLSWSIREGRSVVAASRKYDRICQVGTQCRASKALREAMAFLAAGGIGDCKFARGLCYKRRKSIGPLGNYDASIPESLDFSLWSGPATFTAPKLTRPNLHYDWHWQRHYGNGDLGNQGPHQTDIARWGLGLYRHPKSVIAYGGRLGYQTERNDPNYVDAGDTANTEVSINDYGDKCIVFETRGLETEPLTGAAIGVIFYGSDGYLVQSTYTKCVAFDSEGKETRVFEGGGDHYGNFLDAVQSRNRDALYADCLEGHYSAAISHLGNASYYQGEQNKLSVQEARAVIESVPSLDDNTETFDRTVKHLEDNGVDLKATPLAVGPLLTLDPEAFPSREYREGFEVPAPDEV